MYAQIDFIEAINNAKDERELLSIAYTVQGGAKAGFIKPEKYATAMVALAERLGFGITDEALAIAAEKYLTAE